MVASPEFFWIRARVWSTESCRCAAMSARSCVRIRSARSAPRSLTRRSTHGPTTSARPRMPSSPATTTGPAKRTEPVVTPKTTRATTTRPRPIATRAYAAQPPLPKTARKGSMRPDESSHRSRWASSAWRHSSAMPATPRTTGQNSTPWPKTASKPSTPPKSRAPMAMAGPGAGQAADPPRAPPAAAGAGQPGRLVGEAVVGGQEHPQRGVQQDAEAVDEREHHERDPHPQHRGRRGGAPDRPRRRPPRGRRCRGRHGVRTVGAAHRDTIVAGQDERFP